MKLPQTYTPSPAPEAVEVLDPAQWHKREYPLVGKLLDFPRVCAAVITEPGEMQGWLAEALWRTEAYAPFNGRALENYYTLAFFYAYDAPWNVYRGDPTVLERLRLVLGYLYRLMREDGAIPEYAVASIDRPMLAPSSFGAMYMSFALEVAGKAMPADMARDLSRHCLAAARFALSDQECYCHATSFSNQILGAMVAAAKLARLNGDPEALKLLQKAGEALLGDFMSPAEMGFLYEQDGADTFAYFFTTLWCLVALYQEWPDARVLEVLRRHGAWMSRWMLPEPGNEIVLISTGHETRSTGGYRLPKREFNGLGALMDASLSGNSGDEDERRYVNLLLLDAGSIAERERNWEAAARDTGKLLATEQRKARLNAYPPVDPLLLYPPYAPLAAVQAQTTAALPCLDRRFRADQLTDSRGNQYVFVRQRRYYMGFAYQTHWSQAHEGPQFLWLDGAGTIALSANCGRGGWETLVGEGGTGRDNTLAEFRRSADQVIELTLKYSKLARIEKTYTLRPESVDVSLFAPWTDGRQISEQIPLLLRDEDVISVDYGRAPTPRLGFAAVTRTLMIERRGQEILRLELPAAVQVRLKPTVDGDGFIRSTLTFPFPGITFNRAGYRLLLGAT